MSHRFRDVAELGRIIRYHRKQAGLTRARLAALAGVGSTVLYELEHGKRTVQLKVLLRVLDSLNITLSVESPLMDQYLSDAASRS